MTATITRLRVVALLVGFLWLSSTPAGAQIALGVQDVESVANAASVTTTAVPTQASGSVLVAVFQWHSGGGATFSSITDSKGNTWTQINSELTLPANARSRAYYVENASGGASHTVTITISQAAPITIFFLEIRGARTSGALDQASRASDTAMPWVSPSITTTQAAEMLIGVMFGEGPGGTINHTAGNSFIKVDEQKDGSNFYNGLSMYRIVSATGTYNTSVTSDNEAGTDDAANWIFSFKAAGAGGGPNLGQWRTVTSLMPINPIHLALTHDGKVLVVAGSGNVATETNYQAVVWDPANDDSFVEHTLGWDMFCNGMSVLPDGRVFINGGNLQYDPFFGQPRNAAYDPVTGTFTDLQNMADGRWYPTVTTLGDGRVMSFSGLKATGGTNTTVEIYTPGSGWSQPVAAGWTPPLYPRMHLSTDGRVFYAGSSRSSRFFTPSTMTWSAIVATTNYGSNRNYGTSVLLPLTPANSYRPRVMIFGGGNPSTATTEIIDLSVSTPQWQYGPSMSQPRIQMNATILPNEKVLVVGGSYNDEDAGTASLNADLYDPSAGPLGSFSSAGANSYPRLYHSGSLLLPDATVMLVGGNPTRGSYEPHIEIYSPPYLFTADGTPAIRPTISDVTPGTFGYGQVFQVQTPDASDIASVVLVRPGAQTHAFDMEQRLVGVSFAAGQGVLNVTAPPNGNIAPPGYYMLYVLNANGVPSHARFVRLSTSVPNQAPTATISSPAANVTVNPGGSVSFTGTGTDPDGTISAYAWTFPGGVPTSSSVAAPGNVVYSTPGTYTASFTVTDNGGLTSPTVTRTITVADFSLAATPASRTIVPGGNTTYAVTVSPLNGFTGTVGFSVTGLPSGATATFSPTSVTTSGSTTLTVSTTAATPVGTYPLTITGTSGPRTRTANVTLVVNGGDFSISVSPASRTIPRDGDTTYAVTITSAGFSGNVTLTVSGLPKFANGGFNPSIVTNAGTSTLTINTNRNVAPGTYTLNVTGTSGSIVHSATATLIIQ